MAAIYADLCERPNSPTHCYNPFCEGHVANIRPATPTDARLGDQPIEDLGTPVRGNQRRLFLEASEATPFSPARVAEQRAAHVGRHEQFHSSEQAFLDPQNITVLLAQLQSQQQQIQALQQTVGQLQQDASRPQSTAPVLSQRDLLPSYAESIASGLNQMTDILNDYSAASSRASSRANSLPVSLANSQRPSCAGGLVPPSYADLPPSYQDVVAEQPTANFNTPVTNEMFEPSNGSSDDEEFFPDYNHQLQTFVNDSRRRSSQYSVYSNGSDEYGPEIEDGSEARAAFPYRSQAFRQQTPPTINYALPSVEQLLHLFQNVVHSLVQEQKQQLPQPGQAQQRTQNVETALRDEAIQQHWNTNPADDEQADEQRFNEFRQLMNQALAALKQEVDLATGNFTMDL